MSDIEERCLSLPNKEKVRLIEILRQSLEIQDGKTFEKMHNAIVKVMGCEVIVKSQERKLVLGRTILAYACAKEGWSETMIGRFLQKDHSTIHKLKEDMKYWLKKPNVFKRENDIYIEFLKELNNETDK